MKKIIPKDRKQAAALQYDSSHNFAPIVTALGQGTVADRIIEKALQNEVPVLENIGLSQMLQALSVGDSIPPKLYEAVAQIFAYIFRMDQKYQGK
ncbi:MAG: EscU/YscU/HrcU family type III secretion system export apparatus switch protein [Eubacteriales bacterium]